ncbi:unnamed protein product, partial [Symbiodinium natans]
MPEGSHRHDALCSQNVGNSLGSRPCVRQTALYKQHESGNAMKALLGTPHLSWDPAGCRRAEGQKPVGDRRRRFLPRREEDRWDKVTSSNTRKTAAGKVKEVASGPLCPTGFEESDDAKVPSRRPAVQRSAINAAGRIVTRAGEKAAAARGANHGNGSVAECLTMQDFGPASALRILAACRVKVHDDARAFAASCHVKIEWPCSEAAVGILGILLFTKSTGHFNLGDLDLKDEVLDLCLEFLRLPAGSGPADSLEETLTTCSRAMLGMARTAKVALARSEPGSNATCSTASVIARYPSIIDEERFEQIRTRQVWQAIRAPLESFRLLKSLANHTAQCKRLGRCAVFNFWEPGACYEHHPLIRSFSPSCSSAPPALGPRRLTRPAKGRSTDWLGNHDWCHDGPQAQLELTRVLECRGLIWGPLPGEDYFETISLLQAVTSASDSMVLVEVGSNTGYWSLKGAKAFRRLFPDSGSCTLVLIEWILPIDRAAAHLNDNDIYSLCNVSLHQAPATPELLDGLFQTFGKIDLVNVDVQKVELSLIMGSALLLNARHLHVGTHSRIIHRHLLSMLNSRGFEIDFDYMPLTFVRTPYGPVAFDD